MGAWFEDASFWEAYASLMFDEKRWAETGTVVGAIERLTESRPGMRVLDACCGPGRHSLEFASRGYAVTGLDITESYLEAARESAEDDGLSIDFLQGDIRSWRRPGYFDLCVNLFTSFGYFETPEEDIEALRNLRDSLKPGGRLVLEMIGKETAARDFKDGEWFERAGWTVCTEYEVVGAWEGLKNRWLLISPEKRIDRSFVQRLYSATELRDALLKAGFTEARCMGGFAGEPYDQNAGSLVALATV